jgi:hypothetical protein
MAKGLAYFKDAIDPDWIATHFRTDHRDLRPRRSLIPRVVGAKPNLRYDLYNNTNLLRASYEWTPYALSRKNRFQTSYF